MSGDGVATAAPLSVATAWSAGAAIAQAVARLLAAVMVARLLPPADAGAVIYFLWLTATVALVVQCGIPAAVQRFTAELDGSRLPWVAEGVTRLLARLGLVLTASGALVVALVATMTSPSAITVHVLWALALMLGLDVLGSAVLAGRQRFASLARRSLAGAVLLLLGVGGGAHIAGITGALGGYALASLPLAAAGVAATWQGRPQPLDAALRRRLGRYALGAWLAALGAALVWGRLELVFLDIYRSAQELADYGIALSWATMVGQLPLLALGPLMPHFAAHQGGGDRQAAFATYALATKLLLVTLVPLCLVGVLLTPVLLPAIFGPGYDGAVPAGMLLAAAGVLGCAAAGSALLHGLGHAAVFVWFGAIGAALMVPLAVVVIPQTGPVGAATVRIVVQVLLVGLGTWYIARRIGCPVPVAAAIRVLAVAAAAVAVGLPAWLLMPSGAGRLAVTALVVAGAYLGLLARMQVFTAHERLRLTQALARVPASLRRPLSWCCGVA
jgi:O-antigen/teichoic acid export membrane protein